MVKRSIISKVVICRTLVAILIIISQSVKAQTMTWELMPTNYDDIVRFGPNLYQVTQGGKKGIIHSDGEFVVPIEADDIGFFYDHLALVTANEADGRTRVLGTLTDEGVYTPFPKPYYTLKGQEFFSNELLTVEDNKRKKGYVNAKGTVICGFNKKYYRIKPFTDGYAAVSERSGYFYLINKEGEKRQMLLPKDIKGRKIDFAYNPWHNKTLIIDDYNHYYQYNLVTDECLHMGKDLDDYDNTDYLFRPQILTHQGNTVPFEILSAGIEGIHPVIRDGKYGFIDGENVVLPCQLDMATAIKDNLSIVSVSGKNGILRYYPNQSSFSLVQPDTCLDFDMGKEIGLRFTLGMPEVWQGKNVEVSLTDFSTSEDTVLNQVEGVYTYMLKPEHSVEKHYAVNVDGDGLLLWTGELTYILKRNVVPLVITSLAMDGTITDLDRKLTGSFVVYNPNEEEITANICFTENEMIEQFAGFPKTVQLNAGEQKKINFFLVVKRTGEWEYNICVSTSKGGTAHLTTLIDTY